MGKLGRFACILTPMILTLASLCAVVVLLISGTKQNLLPSLYFIRIDVRDMDVSSITREDNTDLGIPDFYVSYLWNYCSGDVEGEDSDTNNRDNERNDRNTDKNGSNTDNSGDWKITRCSSTRVGYSFDVEEIIQDQADQDITFPKEVQKVQKAIKVVSKFMVACYVIGSVATIVTFMVGWFGLLSRWGSCVTTIFADIAFGFLFTASLCATILAYSLKGAFNKAIDDFGVEAFVGRHFIITTWVMTALALASAFFWMMSMCCCSGRTKKVMDNKGKTKGTKAEHTGGGYQRVASPYQGGSTPLTYGGGKPVPGYEPMRHV